MVAPHGGSLVDRIVSARDTSGLLRLVLDARELADLELIAVGAASPLTGFLGRADYERVLAESRLASGVVWPLPFTLAAPEPGVSGEVALADGRGRVWGVLRVAETFRRDPRAEALAVYGTDDPAHPGVAYTLSRPEWAVGGEVEVFPLPELPFQRYRLTPAALRAEIARRGWKRVAGFQTRNPIHRAHEHLTKLALEQTDGLVLHPLVGETKNDDVPAAVRFRAYEVLIARYYPPERTILAAFPAAMRYAGPREALFHAIARKNYGITHFIVGRDHAGVGKFYPPLAAQEIFDKFPDLGVEPLKFEPTFYCTVCANLASPRTCPHDARLELSGSKVRDILRAGGDLPREFTRPEVAEVLREHYAPRGFIVWFTGLSGAGKSTLAQALARRIGGERRLEILDGDEVRTHLSKGLGFSREDRDTNIHRIGYVARTLARHGVGVVTAAISPYADTRAEVRRLAEENGVAVVEVFASAKLEALVARDVKGLYKKALAGEVAHFTGVSDPYEAPARPDVEVRTDVETVEESLEKIVAALRARGLLKAAAPNGHAAEQAVQQ